MSTVLGPPVMTSDSVIVNIVINVGLVAAVLFVFGSYPLIKMIAKRNKEKKLHLHNRKRSRK